MSTAATNHHAAVTLPPGNLPMRERFNNRFPHEERHLVSACGSITRCACPPYSGIPVAPIGCWSVSETRIDSAGQEWIKRSRGCGYYVIDNFGDLIEVPQ